MARLIKVGLGSTREDHEFAALVQSLRETGNFEVKRYKKPGKLLQGIRTSDLEAVLIDAQQKNALEWIQTIRNSYEMLPIVAVSDWHADLQDVIDIMKQGVNEYLISPSTEELIKVLEREVERYRLWKRVHSYDLQDEGDFPIELSGVSKAVVEARNQLMKSLLIRKSFIFCAPKGAGKLQILSEISRMRNIPMVVLTKEEFSERLAAVEPYHTVVVDHIEQFSDYMQRRIVENIRKGKIRHLVVTCTLPPRQLAEQGKISKQIYDYSRGALVLLPRLHERHEDIPVLAFKYLYKFSDAVGKYFDDFTMEALNALVNFPWPNDVLELRDEIERIVLKFDASTVTLDMLSSDIKEATKRAEMVLLSAEEVRPLNDVINTYIEYALSVFGGDINKTARALGIGRATIYRRISKYGIKRKP